MTDLRPSRSEPLSLAMAASASASDSISTNPKPRERPVILSVRTSALATGPTCAKWFFRRSEVVAQAIDPTQIFSTYCYHRTPREHTVRASGKLVHMLTRKRRETYTLQQDNMPVNKKQAHTGATCVLKSRGRMFYKLLDHDSGIFLIHLKILLDGFHHFLSR